jgi:cytochrome c-type biogenesis protein CcmH/NrfF
MPGSVLLGMGDRTFRQGQTLQTGNNYDSAAVGDFNGDGKTFTAVASPVPDSGPTSATLGDSPLISNFSKLEGCMMLSFRFRRWVRAGVVCLLAVVMLGADPSSRFNKVGHEMICTCGCGQVLLECNHVGCPVSPVMIGELHAQMDGGGSDTSILNWFAVKYGATVLAAPIRGGFDNVAWIAPIAVFLLATVGVGFLIRMWMMRSGRPVPVSATGPSEGGDALWERIRRETEY